MRHAFALTLIGIGGFAGWTWLQAHPKHNPMSPLDLRDPIGLATATKLVALRDDPAQCRAVLDRSAVAYTAFPASGEGPCARPDRTQLTQFPLGPSNPAVTCPVAAALELWRVRSVEPAIRDILGTELVQIEHMGVYNCRRIRGSGSTAWSQHATGNAIDIAAFTLADGRRISVLDDWGEGTPEARFLQRVRDEACGVSFQPSFRLNSTPRTLIIFIWIRAHG